MIATVTLNPSLDEWITLPALRVGALNRASGFARYPGGKGINVSRVVHELGSPTVAFALAGGSDGQTLHTLLQELGIRHSFVSVNGTTRNNYKIRTTRPRALTEVNTAGPLVSAHALRVLQQRVIEHSPAPRCVVLSGSLPPRTPSSIYQRWIGTLTRRGTPTVLDASGAALRFGLRARPWLIKPNRQEAEELLGHSLRTYQACIHAVKQLVEGGPAFVILSLGADGALLARADDPSRVWHGRAPKIRVNSTVGAGDSLVGGFVTGWVRRWKWDEMFRLGIACGTATAMTPGTELCHQRDVQRIFARVTIRRVSS